MSQGSASMDNSSDVDATGHGSKADSRVIADTDWLIFFSALR